MDAKARKTFRSSWGERLRRWGRFVYLRLVRQNDEPEKVAKGVSLGVFLGIFPTFGVGTLLAVLLASWVKWNRAAAALGTFIMAPPLNPFFLFLSVVLGNSLVPPESRIAMENLRGGKIWSGMLTFVPTYLLGNLIISVVFAALAYGLTLVALQNYRRRRAARLAASASRSPQEAKTPREVSTPSDRS